jgi:hypothetical protein
MSDKLTIKQEAFAQEVFKCGKPDKALVVAYPTCAKWRPESIRVKASRMMAKANITLRIEHLQAKAATRNEITFDRWLKEWSDLSFTNLPGIVNFDGARMSIADFATLTEAQRKCIQNFKVKTETVMVLDDQGKPSYTPVQSVEVKLYSKIEALREIGKALGFGKGNKRGGNDDDSDNVPVVFEVFQNINITNNYAAE